MRLRHAFSLLFLVFASIPCAGQRDDADYSDRIKALTTEKFFLTELVDHLPASTTVPSPLKVLGYIAGDSKQLTYSQDLYRYYRELAKASPRVRIFTAPEKSEEGKEQLLVVISDEANLAQLDHFKEITAQLADPRHLSPEQAKTLTLIGKPFYWASGSIHSPETGSPEMLMELAYRLAVEETPFIQNIRRDSIVMITPVLEVDGHDRVVDLVNYHRAFPDRAIPPLVYWGKYVAHDNNRDALGMALALSRNQMKTFLEYHPQVLHDLHESVPYLYISTGTGPYNAWLDPIVVDEWHQLAYNEVGELTRRGVPGVWTHGFYDGWATNYMFFVAQGHNSIGRFYETFGHMLPETIEAKVDSASNRDWFRPNPPLPKVKWSLRNNVNLQQSGILLGIYYVATNRERFLMNFYLKSLRAVQKPQTEGPAAYVISGNTRRPIEAASMVNKLRELGVEVYVAEHAFTVKPPSASTPSVTSPTGPAQTPSGEGASVTAAAPPKPPADLRFPAGSYIIRMDQPYSRMADSVLDTQYFNPNDPQPYDDTGWTMGALRNVATERITDKTVLSVPMTLLHDDARVSGGFAGVANPAYYAIDHTAENPLITLRYRLKDIPMSVAEESFKAGGANFSAGTVLLSAKESSEEARRELKAAAEDLGLKAIGLAEKPSVKTHAIGAPRIAVVHTWGDTQNEGWYRVELDRLQIPYTYISTHAIRDTPNLRRKFDVIVFPPCYDSTEDIVRGSYRGSEPLPWKASKTMPNVGRSPDQSEDIRGGMEFTGLANLQKFVEEGGLYIGVEQTARLPISVGMISDVRAEEPRQLKAQGSVFEAKFVDRKSPISYGYDEMLPIYFSGRTLLKVTRLADFVSNPSESGSRPSGRGRATDRDVVQGRPQPEPEPSKKIEKDADIEEKDLPDEFRIFVLPSLTPRAQRPHVILRFSDNPKDLLISGMLAGESELAGRPAIVDVPLGKGHMVLFANNPMWRHETQGSFFLLFNAILNYDHLDAGRH